MSSTPQIAYTNYNPYKRKTKKRHRQSIKKRPLSEYTLHELKACVKKLGYDNEFYKELCYRAR